MTMASDAPGAKDASAESKFERKSVRRAKQADVQDLERRVHLAELRAREAEAELRFIEASEKRRALKNAGRERNKENRSAKKKAKGSSS
jgi:hypothetical protein